jgi:hypothetical protein
VSLELFRLRHELTTARDMANGDCWYWQGDGEDHLESLVCPVVIRPEELSELIQSLRYAWNRLGTIRMNPSGDPECVLCNQSALQSADIQHTGQCISRFLREAPV